MMPLIHFMENMAKVKRSLTMDAEKKKLFSLAFLVLRILYYKSWSVHHGHENSSKSYAGEMIDVFNECPLTPL